MAQATQCSEPGCERELLARGMCSMHYARLMRRLKVAGIDPPSPGIPPEDRFWSKVDKNGPDGCWLWTGGRTGSGYGAFSVDGVQVPAHRWVYERYVGPIPEGYEVDHVEANGCRHRHCVNYEAHLEAVTPAENKRRSSSPIPANHLVTECPRGHPYDEANTYRYDGRRFCRACLAAKARRKRRRQKVE